MTFLKTITNLTLITCSSILLANSAIAKDELVYKYRSKSGIPSFSDIEPQGVKSKLVQVGCYACNVGSMVNWYKTPLNRHAYKEDINKQAFLHNVDPALIRAIIHAESHFQEKALSKAGAQGLMQLMPRTARSLGVKNSFNAQQNIAGGTKHLATLLAKYRGNIKLVAAAYNAGEGAVKKYGGIPPYSETQIYVDRVKILHSRYKKTKNS